MNVQISKATEYNWKKLNSDTKTKLTKRANKTMSTKRVVASSYLNDAKANQLLYIVSQLEYKVEDIMYTLCVLFLKNIGIYNKAHVRASIKEYEVQYSLIELQCPEGVWDTHDDVLGFIYQSLITEGEKNSTGQYYTTKRVFDYMVDGKILADEETFLDPCCGSGAFLLGIKTNTPSCLYGFDINPIVVMLARTNLLVRYSNIEFTPNVYCIDYIQKNLFVDKGREDLPFKFDNIYTNPPWGADKKGLYAENYSCLNSKERASMTIVESLTRLSSNGELYFLLPTSLLKIKTHKDIRHYILFNSIVDKIDLYTDRFDGVFTDYFSIKLHKGKSSTINYKVCTAKGAIQISLSEDDINDGNIVWESLSQLDHSIISKLESHRHDDLRHSQWALGIVTGDNKNKVKKQKSENLEPVFIGKQVDAFNLKQENLYIKFAPDSFQQCAKEEYFRAPEKLIYRFIAKYPIVAYDDKQCLCLNSANILIPQVDGLSIKTVAAFLNSSLYHFYYSLKFTDIKVLKGNLQELPFPKLTAKQNDDIANIVTEIHATSYSSEYQEKLNSKIYSIFGITEKEQLYIHSKIR